MHPFVQRARRTSGLLLPAQWFFLALLISASNAQAAPDNQLWLDQNFSYPLSPRVALRWDIVQRFDRDVSHLFQADARIALALKPTSWFTFVPGFRHVRHDPFDPNSRFENRLVFDAEFQGRRRGPWQPNFRTRIEGRFFENQRGFLRVRPRPGVQYTLPVGWQRPPALVVNNEFFFDTRADRYNRNKLVGGVSLRVTEQFSLLPYYMLLSNRGRTWRHDNVWGLSTYWNF